MAVQTASRRVTTASAFTVWVGVFLVVSGNIPAAVASMFDGGLPPNPWFVPPSAAVLYALLPLTVPVGIAAWMLPGLLLTASWRRDLDFAPWILSGFLVSLLAHWALGAVANGFTSGAVSDLGFLVAWQTLTLFALAAYMTRERRGRALESDASDQLGRRLALSAGLVLAGVVLLLPKTFRQDVGAAGCEALERVRSLAWFARPRVPSEASVFGLGAGMVPQAVPIRPGDSFSCMDPSRRPRDSLFFWVSPPCLPD